MIYEQQEGGLLSLFTVLVAGTGTVVVVTVSNIIGHDIKEKK
jgi:hypothetical protein